MLRKKITLKGQSGYESAEAVIVRAPPHEPDLTAVLCYGQEAVMRATQAGKTLPRLHEAVAFDRLH
jgi:hypothetical protein